MDNKKKIIFVTGGVISSLGKGIIASSVGRLLKDQGIDVNMMKLDPYLNVDSGTMSPIEHGETFVTTDGGETDLDLGHYERFLNQDLTKESSLTSGKVYQEIITKERNGDYLGKTVQIIPHVTDIIKNRIYNNAKDHDVLIAEIGGSVGDIESLAYTETIRQIKFEMGEDCLIIHVGYVPFVKSSKELKTKPMQRSVTLLRSLGVSPDVLITRNEINLNKEEIDKISMYCNVEKENIFESVNLDSIYKVPLYLKEQKLDLQIAELLHLDLKEVDHSELEEFTNNLNNLDENKIFKVAIVGKYTQLEDAYLSVVEALKHAAIKNRITLKYDFINSKEDYDVNILKDYSGILVPGGFGNNGVDGKIKAIKFARENNIAYLGLCYGMQLAAVEFAKNVAGFDAEHGELHPDAKNKIIDIMEEHKIDRLGGTMRLGNQTTIIKPGTLAHKIYGLDEISERHRHRYEFNNDYISKLEEKGLVFSGMCKDTNLVEIIEYPKNDFFIAVQYHPELSSKVTKSHPLFNEFVKQNLKKRD